MWKYLHNLLISVDQLGNVLAGGDPDETISSRLGKIKRTHKGKIPWSHPLARVIDWGLDKINPGHSLDSIDDTEGENAVFKHTHKEKDHEQGQGPPPKAVEARKMKMSDQELEELVYSILIRCPHGSDRLTAQRIVTTIVQVEVEEFSDLVVR